MKEIKRTPAQGRITNRYLMETFGITAAEAEGISRKLKCFVYDNNEAIVTIGDAADGLYFIEEGQAAVLNAAGEAVNELEAGQLFGEYAILADEPRMSTVRAHGKVTAYRMEPEDFLALSASHPKIAGRLIKGVYGQISVKHKRIVSILGKQRGFLRSAASRRDAAPEQVRNTYIAVILFFLVVFFVVPGIKALQLLYPFLPVIFLFCFTLRTGRFPEGLILTLMLLGGMLHGGNIPKGFGAVLINGLGNPDSAETLLIMMMVEAFAALLVSAGVITVFRKQAEKRIRTGKGALFGMLFIMLLVCIDECLNVITAGYCLKDRMDRLKVAREQPALLGSCSTALCSLIPFSVWGAYISGWLSLYLDNGGNVFLKTIPCNLAGLFAAVFAVLLCAGLIPQSKQMKKAARRVRRGGPLMPKGSLEYMDDDTADGVVGRPINLFLPMLVWILSAVGFGSFRSEQGFALEPIPGLIVTLIFMFFLYIVQKLMSPREYFETLLDGISNAVPAIMLFIIAEQIAEGLEELGMNQLLYDAVYAVVNGHKFLLPVLLFLVFTAICMGIGSQWGMFGLGIPVTIGLSTVLGLPVQLCLGAVLSAGIVGENLSPIMDEASPVVTVIGCGPQPYRSLRITYWTAIATFCAAGYLVLGWIFC